MANAIQEFKFHVVFEGRVDRAAGVIRGVRVITGNVTAEGHDLEVDDTTVKQLNACASKSGQVPVNLDHGSGIKDTCGYLSDFVPDGADLRADWHLLKSHAEYEATMERAERMPKCFGLSVKFKGKGEKKGLKKFARCEKLVSVDCVTQPAANPDGLFSTRSTSSGAPPVDSRTNRMDVTTTTTSEPTLADLLAAINKQGEQIASLTQTVQQQAESIEGLYDDAPLTQEEAEANIAAAQRMSDEELAQHGLTRADVEAAVAEANAGGDGTEGGEGAGAEGTVAQGAAAGTVGAALAAQHRKIVALENARKRDIAFAEQQQEEYAMSVIETKFAATVELNEKLVTELASKEAEIKSLRSTLRTGGKGVAPGVESETAFSADPKRLPDGSFEQIVRTEFDRQIAAKVPEVTAKANAFEFGVKKHEDAYEEWRERGGKIIELSAK